MDYKEYSKLRSIARKRIERAAAAGRSEYVFIPTVAQLRKSENPDQYMRAVREYLKGPSLKDKPAGGVQIPTISLPKQLPPIPKQTDEAKRARRNEQKRRSRAKRAVEKSSGSEAEARKKVGYLRALETVAKEWKKQGVDIANWIGILSPSKAKSFVNYMEYRFSQGDYKNRYTIDTFIRDFGELVKRNYDFNDIQGDFGQYLDKQKQLKRNKRNTNKYGITEDEIDSIWRKFVKDE